MSQQFKVDFLFKLCQFTVGCFVSHVAWKYVLCFFVFVFLRSSSILKYVEVVFLLNKKLMLSSIYDNKAVLHFQFFLGRLQFSKKSWGCLPFSKNLRSSSIFRKVEAVFQLEKLGCLPFKKNPPFLTILVITRLIYYYVTAI